MAGNESVLEVTLWGQDFGYDPPCSRCGCCGTYTEMEMCWSCGGRGEWDEWEYDAINYSPGEEIEICSACDGEGELPVRWCLGRCDEQGEHEQRG